MTRKTVTTFLKEYYHDFPNLIINIIIEYLYRIVVIEEKSSTKEIIKEIMDLPPLKETGFLQVDPRRSLICLQAEYGMLDYNKHHGEHVIENVGVTNLKDCIFVFIEDKLNNKYYFAHMDREMKGDYFAKIKEFIKKPTSLEVTLIGGLPKSIKFASSLSILTIIITELINLSKNHQISVVGQLLMEHNFTELEIINPSSMPVEESIKALEKRKLPLYQNFCEQVPILFSYLYHKNFNSAYINVRFPTPDSIVRKLDQGDTAKMYSFACALSMVEIQCFSRISAIINSELPNLKKSNINAISDFYRLVSDMMCMNGALCLQDAKSLGRKPYFEVEIYNKLSNFVIQLKTGKVFSIPIHTKTYNQEYRKIFAYTNPSASKAFLFFSGQHYNAVPQLNNKNEDEYNSVKEDLENSRDMVCRFVQGMNESYIGLYFFRKKWPDEVPSSKKIHNLEQFHEDVLFDHIYSITAHATSAKLISEYASEDCCSKACTM